MKNKLTDYQVENLIENIVNENKNYKVENFKRKYINKLKECKTKKEKFAVLSELYSMRYKTLNEGQGQKFLTEGILSDIVSSGLGGSWNTVKEFIYKAILGKVNEMFGNRLEPSLISAMAIGLSNIDLAKDWRRFLSPIQNCEFFAAKILKGVSEHYVDKKIDSMFGDTFIGDTIRNALFDAVGQEEHVEAIKNKVTGAVCNAIRSAFGGGGSQGLTNLVNTFKSSIQKPGSTPAGI